MARHNKSLAPSNIKSVRYEHPALSDPKKVRYVHPALKAYFGYCLHKAAMRLKADLNDALVEHQIISPQLGVLCILQASGAMSQVEIGDIMLIDKATMVKLIDGLEQRDWIKREASTDDRRVKKIHITKAGKTAFEKLQKVRIEVEKKFFSVLSSDEEKLLKTLIPKLL